MTFPESFASIAQSDLLLEGKPDAFKVEFDARLAPSAAVEALHRSVDGRMKRSFDQQFDED